MAINSDTKTPWKDGIWYSESSKQFYVIVKGNEATWKKINCLDMPDSKSMFVGKWNFGEFDKAQPEVVEKSGKKNFDVEFDIEFMKMYGAINESGNEIYMFGFSNSLEVLKCLTDEELQKLKEAMEPYDAPSNPYITPNPGKIGKLLWLSGKIQKSFMGNHFTY